MPLCNLTLLFLGVKAINYILLSNSRHPFIHFFYRKCLYIVVFTPSVWLHIFVYSLLTYIYTCTYLRNPCYWGIWFQHISWNLLLHVCVLTYFQLNSSWWRHRMETFFCVTGPVTGEFPSQRPVTRCCVFFDMCLNKRLSKQSWGRWFETPWRSLWRHCNVESNFSEVWSKTQQFIANQRYLGHHRYR